MNILFFLTPKAQMDYLMEDDTVAVAMDKMQRKDMPAQPIVGRNGKYIGSVLEGDLLWRLKAVCTDEEELQKFYEKKVTSIKTGKKFNVVNINSRMEDLLYHAINQNFVPVVDDNMIFIGIIKRSTILSYCKELLKDK